MCWCVCILVLFYAQYGAPYICHSTSSPSSKTFYSISALAYIHRSESSTNSVYSDDLTNVCFSSSTATTGTHTHTHTIVYSIRRPLSACDAVYEYVCVCRVEPRHQSLKDDLFRGPACCLATNDANYDDNGNGNDMLTMREYSNCEYSGCKAPKYTKCKTRTTERRTNVCT